MYSFTCNYLHSFYQSWTSGFAAGLGMAGYVWAAWVLSYAGIITMIIAGGTIVSSLMSG